MGIFFFLEKKKSFFFLPQALSKTWVGGSWKAQRIAYFYFFARLAFFWYVCVCLAGHSLDAKVRRRMQKNTDGVINRRTSWFASGLFPSQEKSNIPSSEILFSCQEILHFKRWKKVGGISTFTSLVCAQISVGFFFSFQAKLMPNFTVSCNVLLLVLK